MVFQYQLPWTILGSKFPYIASEVNKRLRGDQSVSKPSSGLYRVRKTWSDVKSQKGAFKNLDNAKRCADKNKGYKVFDGSGKIVYPLSNKKSIDQVAREVISGKWGDGQERKNRLIKEGYNYNQVQDKVNKLLNNKSLDQLVREVIRGDWGNGEDRKRRLTNAGYDYYAIQKKVNQLI